MFCLSFCFSLSRPVLRWKMILWARCLLDGVSSPHTLPTAQRQSYLVLADQFDVVELSASVRFLSSVPVTDRSGLEEKPLFSPDLKTLGSLGRTMWVFLGTLASSPQYINNGFLTQLAEVIQNVLSTSASHCETVRFWWNVAKRWHHGRAFSPRRTHL